MSSKKSPALVRLMLAGIFLLGMAVCVWVLLDSVVFNWWIIPPNAARLEVSESKPEPEPKSMAAAAGEKPAAPMAPLHDQARKGVVRVLAQDCRGKVCGTGTGFVVKDEYIATAAQVVACGAKCDRLKVVDYRGLEHRVLLEAISTGEEEGEGMAVLKLNGSDLPALALQDPAAPGTVTRGDRVVAMGYPQDMEAGDKAPASVSGAGVVDRIDNQEGLILVEGMPLAPGFSGGPVFREGSEAVLGLAMSAIRHEKDAKAFNRGLTRVVSIIRFKAFFQEKTGAAL